ncbi:MAG: hypothetical protein B7O98_08145 [Zestosphaera tikiterensis]|uniref:Uncharacterized protein n=1 Tax=Zestosphaera tikiterensis TaxID=1973259 RepID=A0A2R7Y3K8_9CREN|nr:MAG: hypothetical protein B7O98_08145 [Zestosphaera tikiterensis]
MLTEEEMRVGVWVKAYVLAVATLYVIYGLLQLYNGVISWWFPWVESRVNLSVNFLDVRIPNIFPDPFSGLVLTLVGLILVRSIQLHNKRLYVKAAGFLFVGWVLGVILMVLNVLIIVSDIIAAYYPLLWGSEVEGWSLATDPWGISPHLLLGILLIPLYFFVSSIREVIRGLA